MSVYSIPSQLIIIQNEMYLQNPQNLNETNILNDLIKMNSDEIILIIRGGKECNIGVLVLDSYGNLSYINYNK
jgi:hypothetical protein